MAFCEQCGAKLTAGMRFCEECGAPVDAAVNKDLDYAEEISAQEAQANPNVDERIFKRTDWESVWSKIASGCENDLGLIITRERALLDQIGGEEEGFNALIDDFVTSARKRGVFYHYLNLDDCAFYDGDGGVDSVVSALRKVVDVARPKYLMLLGNEEIIQVAHWENMASDGDEDVESDLCYSTLDTNSPWDGREYDFDEVMRVGRIPSYEGAGLDVFADYFDSVKQYAGMQSKVVPYGLSALVWKDESNDEYHALSKGDVDLSPEVTKDTVARRIPEDANLLFFNLHGSDNRRYWYGQEGCSYPEAFSPEVISGRQHPYFVGVEACYGARYTHGLTPKSSIVMMALRSCCLAFLGSSKIAFGTSRPKGSCADIVIGNYIKYISKGKTAGDAHLEGLKELCRDRASMDDADVKTLAEFALYGDPSVSMRGGEKTLGIKSFFGKKATTKGIHIPMPNVRQAVEMALTEVDAKIEAVVDDFARDLIRTEFGTADLGSSKQAVYAMKATGLFQKVYRYEGQDVKRVAKVYFDRNGRVRKSLVSK